MKRIPSLSIFFPAYNDAKTIPDLIQRAYETARTVTNRFEIIIVNDGSTDNTAAVAKRLMRRYKELRLITHPANRGYGGALISGFRAARYAWVFYTDGDGQYDPRELRLLVSAVTPDTDVVNGYKTRRNDSWYRIIIGSLYNACIQHVFHPPIKDIDCDFRLIRKHALSRLSLVSQSGAICLELIVKLQAMRVSFREIPVHHYPRLHGRSRFFSLPHILKTIADLPALYGYMRTHRT